MDISTLANLINAIAVTAGVIFAAAQINHYRRRHRRDAMLNLVQSFQSPTFARGLRRIIELPDGATAEEIRRALGMKSAFDEPKGSANFERMAPRKPNDYLAISEVFHKTFIAVDEKGTEAAAATAVAMMAMARMQSPPPPPIVVKVDRPFLYAIQHVPSGACLFIGRVTDPR